MRGRIRGVSLKVPPFLYFRMWGESMDECKKQKVIEDLIKILDAYEGKKSSVYNQGQVMDGYTALANFLEVAKYARDNFI